MTPAALRTALAALGLTHTGFARLTGTNPRTVRRWLSGASVVPEWVPVLLAAMGR